MVLSKTKRQPWPQISSRIDLCPVRVATSGGIFSGGIESANEITMMRDDESLSVSVRGPFQWPIPHATRALVSTATVSTNVTPPRLTRLIREFRDENGLRLRQETYDFKDFRGDGALAFPGTVSRLTWDQEYKKKVGADTWMHAIWKSVDADVRTVTDDDFRIPIPENTEFQCFVDEPDGDSVGALDLTPDDLRH